MTTSAPMLTARFWRSRRSAAIAGIVRCAASGSPDDDPHCIVGGHAAIAPDRCAATGLIRLSLHLVPFAGIAFLWFIGVVRDQLGSVEDRLFSTVFLGSGLLFLAMLFVGAVLSTGLLAMLAGPSVNADFSRTAATPPRP